MSQIDVKKFLNQKLPELSSRQKQLVQLIQALCRPSLVKVLGEPFSHLDIRKVSIIGNYVLRRNHSVLMTTHVPEEAE